MELWDYLGGAETVWLLVTVILCVIEGCTINLVTLWFAFGGLGGLICVALGGPVWLQLIVFIVVSFLTMALFRPFAKRHLEKDREATNADRILGKIGLVTVDIDESCKGQISIEGTPWSARSDEAFKEGERVLVTGIEGCKAIVSAISYEAVQTEEESGEEELSEAIKVFEKSSAPEGFEESETVAKDSVETETVSREIKEDETAAEDEEAEEKEA